MIVQGPGTNQYERTWIQMNVRLVDAMGFGAGAGIGVGANLRGHLAFLDLEASLAQNHSTVLNAPLGQTCHIGHYLTSVPGRNPKNALLGVVDQDLILGKSPVACGPVDTGAAQFQTNFWVKIQNYGHSGRIMCDRTQTFNADEFLFDTDNDVGVCGSRSASELNTMNTMTGRVDLTLTGNAQDVTIDLSGAPTTAVLWSTPPQTALAINKPYQTQGFLGWKYTGTTLGAVRNIPELNAANASWNALYGVISGFICCQSPSPRG